MGNTFCINNFTDIEALVFCEYASVGALLIINKEVISLCMKTLVVKSKA